MKGMNAQYLNELISLVVLALMVVALIAAQAGATVPNYAAAGPRGPAEISAVAADTPSRIRIDLAIREVAAEASLDVKIDLAALSGVLDLAADD